MEGAIIRTTTTNAGIVAPNLLAPCTMTAERICFALPTIKDLLKRRENIEHFLIDTECDCDLPFVESSSSRRKQN